MKGIGTEKGRRLTSCNGSIVSIGLSIPTAGRAITEWHVGSTYRVRNMRKKGVKVGTMEPFVPYCFRAWEEEPKHE